MVSIVGFPSIESPMIGIGKAKERLGSNRVSMKNDKNSQENRGEGVLWRAHGLGSSHQVMDVLPDLVILLGVAFPLPPPPPPSSAFDLPVRGGPSSWSVRWCQTFLAETQIGLGWSCGKTQAKPLSVIRRGSGPFQIPSKISCHHSRIGGG